jgi:UDP-N-acetylmuramoyl-L-alanyl-D-glutamate--2,6-diaminopimelate ligase
MIKKIVKKMLPASLLNLVLPYYHYVLSFLGAILYGFPSKKIKVVAITGTKGKTSTAEIVNAILEEAGYQTALMGTLRFKIADKSIRNLFKMTMPGRAFAHKFLRDAVRNKCEWAVIEMTSEGARQFRHRFIELDALIFTNLSPEHIDSHGSYENYVQAKLRIGKSLETSLKERTVLVANKDDKESRRFLQLDIDEKYTYSMEDAEDCVFGDSGTTFKIEGVEIKTALIGAFNVYNILAAAAFAKSYGIEIATVKKAVEKMQGIQGRVQKISAGQDFGVFVDYAHTPDSLEKLYQAFPSSHKICVLGNTGGGRDIWKRKEMGKIADEHCEKIILTNEDPYDEDPRAIVAEMQKGIISTPTEVIMDRRIAIAKAISYAKKGDNVLISGKGTDPYIMGPNDTKIPWSDAEVAEEELKKFLKNKKVAAPARKKPVKKRKK